MKPPQLVFPRLAILLGAACLGTVAQSVPDVGSGSPTSQIQQQFQLAFYRNGFAYQVSLPPLADVKKFGTNGLVQEYNDANKTSGVKFALVLPNINTPITETTSNAVFQVQGGMYSYYTSVGPTTAGMPVTDTIACPSLVTANSCQYQLFDKPYALFVYKNTLGVNGSTFSTRVPYYTVWQNLGGINVMGPANSVETAVTSSFATAATMQTFDRGAVFSVTSGLNNGLQFGVKYPIWNVYAGNNSYAGQLGLPTSSELLQSNGHYRQSFEGGSVEYDPANPGGAFIRVAVSSIAINPATSPIKMKLNDTTLLQAGLFDTTGNVLTDRSVLWTTSNSRVAAIQQNAGGSAIVKAVGGGTALVRATSEGKTSSAITVVVTAPCCQIGEGAPTLAVSQAFQQAVTRNKLNIQLPAASAVTRVGAGYVQQLVAADPSAQVYLIAVPDSVLTGFVVTGKLLAAYNSLGGPGGSLGYPVADGTAGGRQMFERGALAGDPALVVTGDILAKWGVIGYETGIAGAPTGLPTAFLTFRATSGQSQMFRGATLYQVNGNLGNKVYAVAGLILSRYLSAGGASGKIGVPTNDEYGLNGRRRQDFEGGYIDFGPGDSQANLSENPRQPVVTATPSAVVAGTPIHLAVGGFANGATVRVSITGQPDFTVTVPAGAYAWDSTVPVAAKAGGVTVKAVDANDATATAQASYTVRAVADVHFQLAAVSGNNQTGPPGTVLPVPMRVALKDESGNPVPGIPVVFQASPGAHVESSSSVTDARGEAVATLRLSGSGGVAIMTVDVAKQVITFSARSGSTSLPAFPAVSQAVAGTIGSGSDTIAQKGALLAAVTAVLRYYQNRNELPSPNGQADPVALNEYLKAFCILDARGVPVCDGFLTPGAASDPIVNLWRVGGFVGNAVDVSAEKPDSNNIRDLVAQGSPVILGLTLGSGASQLGSHFVVATGVASDGSIQIMDPNPAYNKTSLNDYANGFQAAGVTVQGTVTAAVRLLARTPKAPGFLIATNASVNITAPAGDCGVNLEFPGRVAGTAFTPPTAAVRMRVCDGTASSVYEADVNGASYQGSFTDLGVPANRSDISGSGPASFKAVRSNGQWSIGPLDVSVLANGVVNAASFTADIAPGGIISVFGTGFGANTSAKVNGVDAKVFAAFPFQLNLAIPGDQPPGDAMLHITSSFGSVDQPITLKSVAPALFLIGPGQAAVLNADGTLNTPANPAKRGTALVAFGTGFGTVSSEGSLMVAVTPVLATLDGSPAPVAFAGLTPGFVGLYQVNVSLPVATPPGQSHQLTVTQGAAASNTVTVAIQ